MYWIRDKHERTRDIVPVKNWGYDSITLAVAIQQGNARAMTAGHYWSISSTQVRQQQPSPPPSSVSSSATQNAHIHPERIANIAAASSIVSSVASSVSASSPPSKALVHPQRLANIRSSVSSAA